MKGYGMLNNFRSRTHSIIIILAVFFSIAIQGTAHTKDSKIGNKKQNTKNQFVKKNVQTKKLSSNLEKTSSDIKALKNKLLLVAAQLKTAKKSDAQKGIEIIKLQSESAKFHRTIKALEKNMSLAKTELGKLQDTDAKKSDELIKLKEIINCYRSALFTWDNLTNKQGLTGKENLVVRSELRRSLFACPPI